MKQRIVSLLYLVLIVCLLHGCTHLLARSVKGPMEQLDDRISCKTLPDTLIVMLPGAYDKPQDFIDQGFVAAVRKRRIDADIKLVDAHVGYFTNGQIVKRLQEEIIDPARTQGYRHIWFVGISLGGYGSLLYSMNAQKKLDGVFLMAPFMGPRDIPAAVTAQGGLTKWNGAADSAEPMDIALWKWLQGYATKPADMPLTYIGFGASDRFTKPNTLLVDVLPQERSFVIPGDHDWATWQQLWNQFLDAAPLAKLSADQACANK